LRTRASGEAGGRRVSMPGPLVVSACCALCCDGRSSRPPYAARSPGPGAPGLAARPGASLRPTARGLPAALASRAGSSLCGVPPVGQLGSSRYRPVSSPPAARPPMVRASTFVLWARIMA